MQSSRLMRPRINDRLARATEFPIALIVAPAGFGKSVALRDFLLSARTDAVRCDVRPEDAALLAFARRLAEALSGVAPSIAGAFPEMQQRIMETGEPIEPLCDWFFEHLKRVACRVVVDDLHFAEPPAIEFLADLIDRTYERIHWILATRSDAELPVASWLGYGRMDLPVDENVLRFTAEEALAAADEAQSGIEPREVEALRELTEGWAVALAIALRTRTYASELRSAAGSLEAATREMIYRYLAEQVFAALSPVQRNFLLATSVFPTFDVGIAQALGGTDEFIADLRRGVAFLNEASPGRFRYHDLFSAFLDSELRRQGESTWAGVLCYGGQLLEERGEAPAALALYTKARDAGSILRLMETTGFALFERGHGDALSAALEAVPDAVRSGSAVALGLRAMLDAARGHFDLCRRGFVAAIEKADNDALKLSLVHRYAIELVRHDRACIELLEPYARDERFAPAMRAPLLGTLATALARIERFDDALATIAQALDVVDTTDDDALARLYQQAAYVYRLEPNHLQAHDYATMAVELALRRNLNEVAARAYSVLYQISYDYGDDPIATLRILDRLLECARQAGSTQARLFGLFASYAIEAERGDETAMERIERELETIPGGLPRSRAEMLLPSIALRAGWQGNFREAYTAVADTAETQTTDERRASRFAELAEYAFAGGMPEEGQAAYDAAVAALAQCKRPSRRSLRARLNLVYVDLLRGHTAAAQRALSEVERAIEPSMRWLRAMAQVARTLYRIQLGQAERAVLAADLERLRAAHFGGIARLLTALPFPHSSEEGTYATLTSAEREILSCLATGASTKEIAARTGRSPRTVDTHIRAICQKLRCSGRRAAVAIATGSGWV
ncbi:MAG: hypothetical protein JO192_09055 [Candidatus Eremiobacteraeota bacterium]|nr:hypothetical protein [Candidatus Eremiobacteraeota bacterium]MBV8723483.1 hypothetical protein [Candidatus Eremiobacteraeota bacterium]